LNTTMFSGAHPAWRSRVAAVLLGALLAILSLGSFSADSAQEIKRLPASQPAGISLFAGPVALLDANQLECGITSLGALCTDVAGSATGGSGFWPKGSVTNQHSFRSGL